MLFCRPSQAWKPLLVLLITFPLVGLCASLTGKRFRNELFQWADQESTAAKDFAEYRRKFGINEYVLMTWQGCDLEDDRVDRIEAGLKAAEAAKWIDQVSSGKTIYDTLVKDARLSEDLAKRRLIGSAIGADGNSTGIFLKLTAEGRAKRAKALVAIKSIAAKHIAIDQIRWAGLGHDLHVLDKEGFRSPFRMVPWIMLTALMLTWYFVGNLRLALFINALGVYCGCLSFTFIYFAGADLNAIVWPLPTLMMLLTVSASLHFLGYYRSAASSQPTEASLGKERVDKDSQPVRQQHATVVQTAWSTAWRPTMCCAITTAVGLLSLLLSHTQPVRQFGLFGSLSILASCLIVLIALPAWLTTFPPAPLSSLTKRTSDNQNRFWSWLAGWTCRNRTKLIAGSIVVLLFLGWFIPHIRTGGNLRNFFPADNGVITDAKAVEKNIGPLSSIELLLEFEHPQPKNDIARVRLIDALGRKIVSATHVSSVVSAATFAPVFRSRPGLIERTAQRRQVEGLKEEMVALKLLHVSTPTDLQTKSETWRMSLRYSGLESADVAALASQSVESARRALHGNGNEVFDAESATVTATGEFVLFDNLDRQFLGDLVLTYATAFVLVMLVVSLVLRSIKGSLLAILPNMMPAVLIFGAAGFMNCSLDVASLMTASVALGIAVDDTLHLLIWWRSRRVSEATSHQSLVDALEHCGMAVVQSSVICGFSVGLYAFCGFLPTVRFGILLPAMLLAALVGDLLLLPALLSTSIAKEDAVEATTETSVASRSGKSTS